MQSSARTVTIVTVPNGSIFLNGRHVEKIISYHFILHFIFYLILNNFT